MSKKTKIWLMVAASLILTGLIIFAVVMTVLKWDFRKLSTFKYETNEHVITEEFKNITVIGRTENIVFLPSDNSEIKVICYEQEKLRHVVSVKNGTLVIELKDERKWYEHIGINFSTSKLTIYLPNGKYGDLNVKSSTGDVKISGDLQFNIINVSLSTGSIKNSASASGSVKLRTSTGFISVENINAASLDLLVTTGDVKVLGANIEGDVIVKVSTGDCKLTNVKCDNVISGGNTGDLKMTNVIAEGTFAIKRSTGDVELRMCDANDIEITTDTGDVKGILLTEKIFFAKSDTGSVEVPESVFGGRCKITTDTGDIRISIAD